MCYFSDFFAGTVLELDVHHYMFSYCVLTRLVFDQMWNVYVSYMHVQTEEILCNFFNKFKIVGKYEGLHGKMDLF